MGVKGQEHGQAWGLGDEWGEGVAGLLVQMAVDQIREQGGEVRATCSYAAGWLEKNK